jgi:hypothetical protein
MASFDTNNIEPPPSIHYRDSESESGTEPLVSMAGGKTMWGNTLFKSPEHNGAVLKEAFGELLFLYQL